MAQFPGLSLTLQGNKMILKSSTGKVDDRLIITKAVIGDGQLTTNIENLTSLVSPKLEIGLSNVKEVTNGQMQLQFNFDNKKVETGFYWREVGIYGKSGDSGQEKLIGYSNANGLTSYIPDKTNAIPMQRLLIALGVGDNPNVKGLIDLSTAITREQLDESIKTHNLVTKGDNSQEIINFITSNYNDSDINKVLNLGTLKTLLGQGAIVASKLDANAGFVKFANGFTIQWGLTWFLNQNTYCDVTLPIQCNVLVAMCTDDSESVTTRGDEFYVSWNSGFSNNNRTSIRFLTNRGNADNFTWLCVGKA